MQTQNSVLYGCTGSSPVKYAYHIRWGLTTVAQVWIRPSHNILHCRTSVNSMKMWLWFTCLALCRTLFHPQSACCTETFHCSHLFYRRCHRLMVVLDVSVSERGWREPPSPSQQWPLLLPGCLPSADPTLAGEWGTHLAPVPQVSSVGSEPGCCPSQTGSGSLGVGTPRRGILILSPDLVLGFIVKATCIIDLFLHLYIILVSYN